MAKEGKSGCGLILGIFLLMGILAALSRVIGVIMILASVGGAIYLFKNKETFQAFPSLKKTGVVAGLIFLFIVGFALALPSSQEPQVANTPSTQITEKEKVTQKQDEQETQVAQVLSLTDEQKPQEATPNSPLTLEKAVVISVTDGDTIAVRLENGAEEKVRFIGVDTPESTTQQEPYGKEASAFTKNQLDGKTVYLEKDVSDRDKYGRLLRYVWLEPPAEENNENEIRTKLFNAILLLRGYAQVATYPPDVKYTNDYFVGFQAEAREANKGLWGIAVKDDTTATNSSSSAITVYVTNTGSKYHRDGCRTLKSKIPISLDKAKASYEPCKVCNPPS